MLAVCDPTIRATDIEPLLSDSEGLKPGGAPKVSVYARDAYKSVRDR